MSQSKLGKAHPKQTVLLGQQPATQMGRFTSSMKTGCVHWQPYEYPVVTDLRSKRVFTDTDMHDSVLQEEMEEFYNCMQNIIRHDRLAIPSNNYDLVLDIMPTGDGRVQWSYYYACHETRCLFWFHLYDAKHMISEVFSVTSPAHVSES